MNITKRKFPFSLGTTSYIYPVEENNLEENVRMLMHSFDKIQLLFFGKNYLDQLIHPDVIDLLRRYQQESGVQYTIHLPIDICLLDSDDACREGLDVMKRILRACSSLSIENMILHIEPGKQNNDAGVWALQRFESVLSSVKRTFPSLVSTIHVENTFYDLLPYRDIIASKGFNVCMDIGHLYISGQSFSLFTEKMCGLIREIHLHGFEGTGDHKSISVVDPMILSDIASYLKRYESSLILEVFNEPDLVSSLTTLDNMMKV